MKEKKTPGPCHSQHVQVLNCLTDTLKDELKRGLTLLDNCVNQLAQAKWILINVERTMEDFYQDCPACEGVPPKGNRASTPTPSTAAGSSTSYAVNVGKKTSSSSSTTATTSKTKKASVLPMVSGHTVQRPKIKIARVDARGSNKKTKRSEVRSRSTSSGIAAESLEAVPSSSVNNLDETVAVTSSRKKCKPGPRSRTRILANGGIPSNYNLDGNNISVDLEDIGDILEGRESISGAELYRLMNVKDNLDLSASTSNRLVESENRKKNKIDTTNKNKEESETSSTLRKKVNEKAAELKPLSALTTATSTLGGKPDVKSLIQQTFLQFAKNKDFGKLGLKAKLGGMSSTPAVSKPASTEEHDDKKGSSSEVVTTTSIGTTTPSTEKQNNDEKNSDTEPVKKGIKRKEAATKSESKVSDSKNVLDSDDSDSETLAKKIHKKKSMAGEKSASENESDATSSSSARKPKRGRKSLRKKRNISDDSDSEFVPPGENNKKVGGGKKPKQEQSGDEDSDDMDVKSKTSERRSSRDSKASSSVRSTRDNKISEPQSSSSTTTTTTNNNNNIKETCKTKPVPKAKRTGGKPLSVKLREENELKKQRAQENVKKEEEEASDATENVTIQNKSMKNSTSVVFSDDSDSDNSVLRTTIRNIPLDLQDAARSPSPETPKDNIFGKLLSAYNPLASSESSVTGVQKLKSRAKEIQNKVFELDDTIQKKLSSVGRELIPYSGKMDSKCTLSTGTYYVIGKVNEEKLVFMDTSNDLQELDLGEEDIQELLDD